MELEFRSAEVAAVDFPRREIELVVTPYEAEAVVEYRGRLIREIFSKGAYGNIRAERHRVNVNRDHDPSRLVGKAVRFHADRDDGLVADVRIAQTDLGSETLQLAHEGMLDASAGFAVDAGGETWEDGGGRRRITKAWLGHIALTPDPAYPDARVLAVRSTSEASVRPAEALVTPNLDLVRGWRLTKAYEAIVTGR